jgi:hypothetical protein
MQIFGYNCAGLFCTSNFVIKTHMYIPDVTIFYEYIIRLRDQN